MSWTSLHAYALDEELNKHRAVLDTNVLLAATLWKGVPHVLLQLAENDAFTFLTAESILREYDIIITSEEMRQKIQRKKLIPFFEEDHIRCLAHIVPVVSVISDVIEDPDDNHILACALDGGATHIVTRDFHLLNIKRWRDIDIVTPEKFLSLLR